jgi:hypothetical protein
MALTQSKPITHIRARAIVEDAFRSALGRNGTRTELLLAQAWGSVESSYGEGWRGAGEGSHNWGAIQARADWKGATFVTRDTHPKSDGSNEPYEYAYRAYPTPEAGAADLMRVLFTGRHSPCLEFATAGDLKGFATSLYRTGYYEGRGATDTDRIFHRRWALTAATIRIGQELNEPLANGAPVPATFRDGDATEWAKRGLLLCTRLGHSTVKVAQQRRPRALLEDDVPADGVCGPATWSMLLVRGEDELGLDTFPAPQTDIELPAFVQEALVLARDVNAKSTRLVELIKQHS